VITGPEVETRPTAAPSKMSVIGATGGSPNDTMAAKYRSLTGYNQVEILHATTFHIEYRTPNVKYPNTSTGRSIHCS
jgi:hypothetical protein